MQAVTSIDREEPRKLNALEKDLSVAELERVPLKKRLEILFISTIIPSRRQLAVKYGLDEQLIHNVLSHRAYILQNWKYNADSERLLSKLELENEMAFMEMLIEWKRRVQLNGLQMTNTALLRKTTALQKILNPNALNISDDWWQLFDDNWEHKIFRDSENDSLEFEDILNDLQWMFTESAFKRLSIRLRRARNGNRTRIKHEISKTEGDIVCLDEDEDYSDLLDISDIKAEPLYYNDDDFECEDYEFVMDEELVFESLRRELADTEAAKYKLFIGANDDEEFLHGKSEENQEDEELITEFEVTKSENVADVATNEETKTNIKTDCVIEELQENLNFFQNTPTTPDSSDPLWPMAEREVPVPIRLEIVNPVTTPVVEISDNKPPKPKPRPYRRKPRGELPVLTVRKDCVRLPASAEICNFTSKPFLAHEDLEEIKNEQVIEQSKVVQTPVAFRKRKNPPKTPIQSIAISSNASNFSNCDRSYVPQRTPQLPEKEPKQQLRDNKPTSTITTGHSLGAQVPIVFKNLSLIGNQQITIAIEEPTTPPMPLHDDPIVETPTPPVAPPQEDSTTYSMPLKLEQETLPSLHIINMSTAPTAKRSKDSTNENLQADLAHKINFKIIENSDEDVELILGIPESLEQSSANPAIVHQLELPTNQQPIIDERRKQKFTNKLKTTSVQILEEKILGDEEPAVDDVLPSPPVQLQNKPHTYLQAEKKNSSAKNPTKRYKRRSNDADLTLRRDKVRIW